MRIYSDDHDSAVKEVILLLKRHEALYLIGALENMLESKEICDHHHINDDTYEHEITVGLYDEQNLAGFSDRMKKLIKEDK